jgi:8-oxo-dGTP pyrophosphatase MutT (NUDIX family)
MSPQTDLQIELIARGLCVRDGRVLLCKSIKNKYFYLPGGHVEYGETAAAALAREFREETGESATVGNLALIHEHFFRQGPHLRHELNLVFHVELATDKVTSREKKLGFEWAAIGDLGELDLRPDFHRTWLAHPPEPGMPPEWVSQPLD